MESDGKKCAGWNRLKFCFLIALVLPVGDIIFNQLFPSLFKNLPLFSYFFDALSKYPGWTLLILIIGPPYYAPMILPLNYFLSWLVWSLFLWIIFMLANKLAIFPRSR